MACANGLRNTTGSVFIPFYSLGCVVVDKRAFELSSNNFLFILQLIILMESFLHIIGLFLACGLELTDHCPSCFMHVCRNKNLLSVDFAEGSTVCIFEEHSVSYLLIDCWIIDKR